LVDDGKPAPGYWHPQYEFVFELASLVYEYEGAAQVPSALQICPPVQGVGHEGAAQVPAWHFWGAVQSLSVAHADDLPERFFATTTATMTTTSIMTPMRGGGNMLAAGDVYECLYFEKFCVENPPTEGQATYWWGVLTTRAETSTDQLGSP
jgi:hypothetical protein